jgi:hypothetical protein
MVTVEGTRERLRYSLEQALESADDEQARYHIRIAAQRLVVLETLGGPESEPTVDGLLDEADGNGGGGRTERGGGRTERSDGRSAEESPRR